MGPLITSKTEYGPGVQNAAYGEVKASFGGKYNSEGVAGIHNPSGGGVHDFQLFDPGSAIAENAC